MLLFLDTETTGLWNPNQAWDHPSQPNLVQLAMMLCYDDPDCTQQRTLNVIIRPEPDWEWGAKAEAFHRITRERALALGEPLQTVVERALALMVEADEDGLGGRVIAHNIQFDTNLMMRAIALCDRNPTTYTILHPFCTMRALTTRMALPSRLPGRPKWPTLDEAFAFACPVCATDPEQRHTAMGDLLMCRDIFTTGRQHGWWS
jgi:DNA polymerase III epsilon subunit-like protein